MKLPDDLAKHILNGRSLGYSCEPDGTVIKGFQWGWGGTAYPPPGYLPWNVLEVGNGDTYGHYWPIGKEGDSPVICTIMHDAWALVPLNSSLAGFIRMHLRVGSPNPAELRWLARDFHISLDDMPVSEAEDDEDAPLENDPPVEELLKYDPMSPRQHLVAANEAVAKRQLDEAEKHLHLSLDLVPEYSEALLLLAQLYRQMQDQRRAADAMMQSLTSPLCFGATDRKKLLHWLQRMNDRAHPDCTDPLWKRRAELTFAEVIYANDDYRVFEELIEDYHRLGMGVRAVRLRVLTGELMGHETVSFRERANWTGATFRSQLKADLERAGLHGRLAAV
jgi:hypothetical protein